MLVEEAIKNNFDCSTPPVVRASAKKSVLRKSPFAVYSAWVGYPCLLVLCITVARSRVWDKKPCSTSPAGGTLSNKPGIVHCSDSFFCVRTLRFLPTLNNLIHLQQWSRALLSRIQTVGHQLLKKLHLLPATAVIYVWQQLRFFDPLSNLLTLSIDTNRLIDRFRPGLHKSSNNISTTHHLTVFASDRDNKHAGYLKKQRWYMWT